MLQLASTLESCSPVSVQTTPGIGCATRILPRLMAKSLGWLRGPRQLARVPTRGELHLQKFEFARYCVEVSACLIGWAQRQALGIA